MATAAPKSTTMPDPADLVRAIAIANRHPDPEYFVRVVMDVLAGNIPDFDAPAAPAAADAPLELTQEAPVDPAPAPEPQPEAAATEGETNV